MPISPQKDSLPDGSVLANAHFERMGEMASQAWQKGGKFLENAYENHPVLTVSAGLAMGIPLARLGVENVAARLLYLTGSQIHTASPYRTLIPLRGYGADKLSAIRMEKVIGSTREAILAGRLTTAREVEDSIATKYFGNVLNKSGDYERMRDSTQVDSLERLYDHATAHRKHRPYAIKVEELVGNAASHQASTEIEGRNVLLVKTHRDNLNNGACWELVQSPRTKELVQKRKEELFTELMATRNNRGDTTLKEQLDRVAEMEWLSGQVWRFDRGSAGISQLQARTWLETAQIDSGKFRKGIDPNLEALTSSLTDYKANYPKFFRKPPAFFEQ